MSNWEDEDWDDEQIAPTPVAASAGDWDDEDEDLSAEEPILKKPSAPMKPKKALEIALKAKEEKERQREIEAIEARERELAELSAVERKMRQQQLVEEADLENTKDLFAASGNDDEGMEVPAEPTLETFNPQTDADFEKFASMIGDRVRPFNKNPRRTGRYVEFLKHVFRSVTKDLGADDSNELSTFLGVLGNEKRDDYKRSKGIKKKNNKKASVRMDRASDVRSERLDDFADDFM